MYLDFEDYRPDIQPIGRAISWREGVLLAFIVHLLMIIALLLAPTVDSVAPQNLTLQPKEDAPRFVFVQPRQDLKALRPPERAEPSDQDRIARAPERAKKPDNPLPFSRGNTPERVESVEQPVARGQVPKPDPNQGPPQQGPPTPEPPQQNANAVPDSQSALSLPAPQKPPGPSSGAGGRATAPGGGL